METPRWIWDLLVAAVPARSAPLRVVIQEPADDD
jgi:hypothetical protein